MPRTHIIRVPDSRQLNPDPSGFVEIPQEFHDELFFLGNKLLGTVEHLHFHTNGGLSAILFHTLFFCPVCGEVWLRRVFSPHQNYNRGPISWRSFESLCPQHGGGSVIQFPSEYESFPLPLLEREVLFLRSRPCT